MNTCCSSAATLEKVKHTGNSFTPSRGTSRAQTDLQPQWIFTKWTWRGAWTSVLEKPPNKQQGMSLIYTLFNCLEIVQSLQFRSWLKCSTMMSLHVSNPGLFFVIYWTSPTHLSRSSSTHQSDHSVSCLVEQCRGLYGSIVPWTWSCDRLLWLRWRKWMPLLRFHWSFAERICFGFSMACAKCKIRIIKVSFRNQIMKKNVSLDFVTCTQPVNQGMLLFAYPSKGEAEFWFCDGLFPFAPAFSELIFVCRRCLLWSFPTLPK